MNIIGKGVIVLSLMGHFAYANSEKIEAFMNAIKEANVTHIKNDLKEKEILRNLRESSDAIERVFFYLDSARTEELLDRREKIAIALLESGADIYALHLSDSLLEEAINENYLELTKYLLKHGDIEKFKRISSEKDFFSLVHGKPMLDFFIKEKLGKLDYKNYRGDTVLHTLLSRGLKSKHGLNCKNLGELSQFIGVKNKQGYTPLDSFVSWASSKEEKECFVDILKQRKSIKAKEGAMSSLLMGMIYKGFSLDAYKLAIEKSGDVNFTADGTTALSMAIEKNKDELVKLLLNKNADVNSTDESGNTLLMQLLMNGGKESMAKLLIEKGVDLSGVNDIGVTALYLAKEKQLNELVKILEKRDAKILTREEIEHRYYIKEYVSALNYKKIDTVRELIHSGKVSINTLVNGDESPLSSLMRSSGGDEYKRLLLINFLIDEGIDLNLGGDTPERLLAKAFEHNRVMIAKKLMSRGAKLDSKEVMSAFSYLDDREFILSLVKKESKLLTGVNMFSETLLTDLASKGEENLKFFNELLASVDMKSENRDGYYNNLFRLIEEHGKDSEIKPFVESMLSHGYKTSTKLHNGKTLLMVAFESAANLDIIKLLIEKSNGSVADMLNEKSRDGRTLAHFIALSQKDVLAYMIKKGVNVAVHGGEDDSTPLMMAIKKDRQENIELLLSKKIVNHEDSYGKTSLNYVEEYDYGYMLKPLKDMGAIANSKEHIAKRSAEYALVQKEPRGLEKILKSGNKKALLKAYKEVKEEKLDGFVDDLLDYGDLNLFKSILDEGLKLDRVDQYGYSLLDSAVYFDNMEVVKFLLEKDADINKKSQSKLSLFKISTNSSISMIKFLIEKGMDTKEDRLGVVTKALRNNKRDIAEFLVKKGFPFDKKNLTDEYIRHYISKGKEEAVAFLLDHGLDVNHKVYYGFHKEPLIINAIVEWENDIAKLLLEKGANIHALIEYDSGTIFKNPPTALSAAIIRKNSEIVSLLLEKGAKVDAISEKDDVAPLLIALQNQNAKIAKMLIEKGCKVDVIKKGNGLSALMYASYYGYFNTVKMLVENGADIKHKDKEGRTAYDIAKENGYEFMLKYLELK